MGTAQIQGELWGARAQDWANIQEPAWRQLYRQVLAAHVHSGEKVLDIGCGAGGALMAAQELGGLVAGLDASPALAAIARQRLPLARVEVGDMEELPFSDGAFDVVTGFNSFQFAGDIVQALREARRVTRPGGRVIMLVWGRKEDCELVSAILPAVLELLPEPTPGAAAPLPLAEPGTIEGLMTRASLSPFASDELDHALVYGDMASAWRAFAAAAPCVRAVRHAGESIVRDTVLARLAPFRRADGTVALKNRFRVVAAERS